MAAKKKAKKALAKKAMKRVKGGAHVDYFLKLQSVEGESTSSDLPLESISMNYSKTL